MDKIKELNQLRQKVFLLKAICITSIIIGFVSFLSNPVFGFVLFLGGGLFSAIAEKTLGNKYRQKFKEMVCRGEMEKLFDVEIYHPDHGFSEEMVKSTYFIPSGNRFHSDDYLKGKYHGISFERSDVCMQDVRSNGKSTTTVTLFKGTWMIFDLPKPISSYLLLREREFLSNKKPGGFFSNAPKTNKVTFEDIDFNEKFDVYAQDEHDAFYLLTPHFMERLKQTEASHEGRFSMGIIHQKLHILFSTNKNLLEPPVMTEVSEETFKEIRNQLYQIITIIEELGLEKGVQ